MVTVPNSDSGSVPVLSPWLQFDFSPPSLPLRFPLPRLYDVDFNFYLEVVKLVKL